MSAGGSPGDGQERRVAPVLGDVLTDPGQGELAVDHVIGPGGFGAEAVVDGHADPAAGGQLLHHRHALLPLVADHPGTAMDIDEDRSGGGRVGSAHQHVELVPVATMAGVVDIADPTDAPEAERHGQHQSPPGRPGRPQVDPLCHDGTADRLVEGRVHQSACTVGDDSQPCERSRCGQAHDERRPPRPPMVGHVGGKGDRPGQHDKSGVHWEFADDERGDEADHREGFASERRVREHGHEGEDQTERQGHPDHSSIKHRLAPGRETRTSWAGPGRGLVETNGAEPRTDAPSKLGMATRAQVRHHHVVVGACGGAPP